MATSAISGERASERTNGRRKGSKLSSSLHARPLSHARRAPQHSKKTVCAEEKRALSASMRVLPWEGVHSWRPPLSVRGNFCRQAWKMLFPFGCCARAKVEEGDGMGWEGRSVAADTFQRLNEAKQRLHSLHSFIQSVALHLYRCVLPPASIRGPSTPPP